MIMPGREYSSESKYRYGFNGKENDNDVKGEGNQQDYGMRIYDPRLGRFLSVDPIGEEYPWNSSYAFAENDPINFIDLDGMEKPPLAAVVFAKVYTPVIKLVNQIKDFFFSHKSAGTLPIKNGIVQNIATTQHRIPKLERGPLKQAKYIILHRTVSPTASSTLSSFSKRGVGTHFLVDKSGEIFQTAILTQRTSHLLEAGKRGVFDKSPDAPHNNNSIGIEVVGMPVDKDGHVTMIDKNIVGWEPLTSEQIKAVATLVRTLKTEFNIKNENIKTHEGVQPKTKGEGETVKQAIQNEIKL